MKIFPTIVTTAYNHSFSNYLEKIKEADVLGIRELCFFPTALEKEERKKAYQALGKSKIRKIPFVHLRHDTEPEEVEFFIKRFGTKVFNIHFSPHFLSEEWSKYRKKIYLENTVYPWKEEEIKNFAGVCLDFSHLEDFRLLYPAGFRENIRILEKYPCGCGHISAVNSNPKYAAEFDLNYYSQHYFESLADFDYLKNYPRKYFPPIIALELENSLEEQLEARDYILKITKSLADFEA
jgi:hypothetical protein